MHTLKFSQRNNRQAFSLIEAAIVLGIIGLVVGGVYSAAASVSNARRVSNLISDIAFIRFKASKLFPVSHYPASGFTNVTSDAYKAGVFPASYTLLSSGSSVMSPAGPIVQVQTSCNTGLCPALNILVRLTSTSTPTSNFSLANCKEFLTRIGIGQTGSDLMKAYVINNGGMSASSTLTPPYTLADVVCGSNAAYIDLRYMP